jgi:hypothetical protein
MPYSPDRQTFDTYPVQIGLKKEAVLPLILNFASEYHHSGPREPGELASDGTQQALV